MKLVRRSFGLLLGALMIGLLLPTTACVNLLCGTTCENDNNFACDRKAIDSCTSTPGCALKSECECTDPTKCSQAQAAACAAVQDQATCSTTSSCNWGMVCHRAVVCLSLNDQDSCSAHGCSWQQNCD